MTWQTSAITISRGNFSLNGKLDNTSDTNFRTISAQWPGLAYALDLGNITRTSSTLVVGMGLIRDPVVSYRTVKTTQSLSHLWYSRWDDIGSAVSVSVCFDSWRALPLLTLTNFLSRWLRWFPLPPLLELIHSTISFNSFHLHLRLNVDPYLNSIYSSFSILRSWPVIDTRRTFQVASLYSTPPWSPNISCRLLLRDIFILS